MPPDLCSTRRIHPAYFISKCFLNFFVPEKNRNIKRMETHQNNNWGVPMFMLEKRGSRTIPYWPNANNSTRVTLREHGILQVGRDIGILEELQPPTNSPEDWRQWWDEWFANNSHRVDCERLLKAHPFANDCRFVLKFLRDHLELLEPNHKLRSTSGEYAELRTKFTRQFDEDGSLGALEELCGTVRDFIDNKLLPLADCLSHQAIQRKPDSVKIREVMTAVREMHRFQKNLAKVFIDPRDDHDVPMFPEYR